LHLNSDDEGENVVIISGSAHVDPNAAAVAQTEEYVAKYREGIKRIGVTVEEMSSSFSVPIRCNRSTSAAGERGHRDRSAPRIPGVGGKLLAEDDSLEI
jgi:hypothetical protein